SENFSKSMGRFPVAHADRPTGRRTGKPGRREAANISRPLNGDIAPGLANENGTRQSRALEGETGRHRQRRSELPDGVRSALVGLGGIGRIGTVGVPFLPLAAVRAAAPIVIATAAVVLPVAGMTLAVMPAAVARLTNVAAAAIGTIEVRSAIILGAVGVPAWPESAISPFAWLAAMLRAELRLRRHDDAVVVFGMLEIALRRDHVAGRESIAGERHVFLGDMRRGSANFDVRAVGLKVPCQWILGLAATAAAPAILLSLPHRLLCNPDKRLMPRLVPCCSVSCWLGSFIPSSIFTHSGRVGIMPRAAIDKYNSLQPCANPRRSADRPDCAASLEI